MTPDSTSDETADSARNDTDANDVKDETGATDGTHAGDRTDEVSATDRTDANDVKNETDGNDASDAGEETVTRRSFVKTAGATAAAAGATAAGAGEAEAQAQTQTYRFGGEVAGWHGRAPPAIEGQTNPSVELQAGQEYEFWFENLDGAPHNIAIRDAEGNTIVESETISEEGATASVTFTATSSMAQYVCIVHPTTMVGTVNVTGEASGGGGGISPRVALFAAGVVLAFLSPLLFAVFLFSRRGGNEGETPAG